MVQPYGVPWNPSRGYLGTRAGSPTLPRGHLLMKQDAFGFVSPASHKCHQQDSSIPGSSWLCLSGLPCPGAAHQALDRGTMDGTPLKRNRVQRRSSALHWLHKDDTKLHLLLQQGNCWASIKYWVTIRAKTRTGDPKPTDLNRRTCTNSLKLSTPLTLLSQCCQQLSIPNTAAVLPTLKGPGSVTLLWVWSRCREEGRRARDDMTPACKERQG